MRERQGILQEISTSCHVWVLSTLNFKIYIEKQEKKTKPIFLTW